MAETIRHLRAAAIAARRARSISRSTPIMRCVAGLATALAGLMLVAAPASADKIKHPIAVFSGLDKITGRIITFEVAANETVQFGSLQITERVCYSRPPTEAPQTDTFIEVDNIDANNQYKRVFTGWMFAGSPSLHALDHPVYDIWLLRCKGNGELIPGPPVTASTEPAPPPLTPAKPEDAAKPQQQGKPKRPAAAIPPAPGAAPAAPSAAATAPAAAAPAMDAPIEVGPPPGFVPPPEDRSPPPSFAPTQPPGDDN
ncbi:MAG: DUF2155 domain-containing protein [Methylovirgula sp.]